MVAVHIAEPEVRPLMFRGLNKIDLEKKEGNMPIRPLDILNCTSEKFFHQMVKTKNIFKDTVVSDSRGCMP
jgi:hypothetical protein